MNWIKSSALFLCLALSVWFFLPKKEPEPWKWTPSLKHPLIFQLTGTCSFHEERLLKAPRLGSFTFDITLEGTPTPLDHGIRYHLKCTHAHIASPKNHPLITFQRGEGHDVTYHVNPQTTPYERAIIYQSFYIDVNEIAPASDQSLFQQQIALNILPNLQVTSIELSPILKEALYRALRNTPAFPLVSQFLNAQLPPLLPSKHSPTIWSTYGQWVMPMIWKHAFTPPSIVTTTCATEIKSTRNNWEFFPNFKSFTWVFHPETGVLDRLSFDLHAITKRRVMNNYESGNYQLEAAFTLKRP